MTHILQVYSKQYVDNLVAENERMKKAAEESEFIAIKATQVAELMAENKNLREALKKAQTKIEGGIYPYTADGDTSADSKQCPHFRTYETESGLACHDCDWTQ